MWPLTGLEIAEACGVQRGSWSPSIESLSIAGISFGEGPARSDELFIALQEEGYDGHDAVADALAGGAALALVSPTFGGRDRLAPEMRDRCLVVTDTLRAFRGLASYLRRRFEFPIVAVGGSNGKTTTKDMIAALLSGPERRVTKTVETMNGWSGLPFTLSQRAHARDAPPAALVVEIGIDAIGAMAEHVALVDPDVVVLTALGPEHMAGLGTMDTVVQEEMELFERAPRATRIFHADDPAIRAELGRAREGDILVRAIGATGDAADRARSDLGRSDLSVVAYEVTRPEPWSTEVAISWQPAGATEPVWRRCFHVPMAGRHNGANFAIAVAAAIALGRSPDELAMGFETFAPPPMRCEIHVLPNDVVVVDDAYNASPSSMAAAFDLLASPAWRERPKVVILGDMLDLGAASGPYHLELCDPLCAVAVDGARVCLFGSAMRAVHDALAARGVSTSFLPADADPCGFVDDLELPLDRAVVLVKGSRGMALERVVAELLRRCESEIGNVVRDDDLAPFRGRFQTACVTGTNGKTTTTSLIAAIVEAAGEPSCRVTTLGAWVGGEATAVEPTGEAFLRTVTIAAERGVRTLAIETTSHSLSEGFALTWPARVAVFTNLSRDHLDYHGTPERYLAAKAQLFMALPPDGAAILNVADPASALLDEVTPPGVRRLGYAARAPDPACAAIPLALYADRITVDERGTHARLAASPMAEALGGQIDLALIGDVHIENALAAALAANALGYDFETIRAAFSRFSGVPGRFEVVHQRPLIVVDYAHTPDALARTLSVARSLVHERHGCVLCVFGCGGDRDPGKRGEMGIAAGQGADVVIITSDNPRSEDPARIADVVEAGTSEGNARVFRLLDRGEAIVRAVEMAAAIDIVVIAGKGHEKFQMLGDRELPFDDVEVAREAARSTHARADERI